MAYTFPTESLYAFMKESDIYKFEYKLGPEGKLLKVDASELQKVKFLDEFEDERLGLERLKLKAVNDKGVVDDKAYNSWQPLLYDGKIKIYGSNLYSCSGSICTFVFSKFYHRNERDDFAVMPIDFDRLNLLNLCKMDEKRVEAFRLVGKGGPEFNKYLDGFYAKLQKKSFRKQVNEDMKMPVDYDRLLISFWKQDEKLVEALRLVGKDCPEFNKYIDFFYDNLKNDKEFKKSLEETGIIFVSVL